MLCDYSEGIQRNMAKIEETDSTLGEETEGADSDFYRDGMERNMGKMKESDCSLWAQIEHAESYLVCSMHSLAASSASSILNQINQSLLHLPADELYAMRESAGMVLVQSMKELGRASVIVDELKLLFHSVASIPTQVIMTGICIQISGGSTKAVQEFLEEYLGKWSYADGQHYIPVGSDSDMDLHEGIGSSFSLKIEEYMELVEFYVVTVLGTVCNNIELAISWAEKAALPEKRKQGLLRKLHSLCSLKATSDSQGSSSEIPNSDGHANSSLTDPNPSLDSLAMLNSSGFVKEMNHQKLPIVKLAETQSTCLWWFRSVTLRFGGYQLGISNGKILLGGLTFIMLYVLRRKKASLQGVLRRQLTSIRKSLIDLWELAFSYQVNPLAAIQPLPAPSRGR